MEREVPWRGELGPGRARWHLLDSFFKKLRIDWFIHDPVRTRPVAGVMAGARQQMYSVNVQGDGLIKSIFQ
jgi:hypothetical protein